MKIGRWSCCKWCKRRCAVVLSLLAGVMLTLAVVAREEHVRFQRFQRRLEVAARFRVADISRELERRQWHADEPLMLARHFFSDGDVRKEHSFAALMKNGHLVNDGEAVVIARKERGEGRSRVLWRYPESIAHCGVASILRAMDDSVGIGDPAGFNGKNFYARFFPASKGCAHSSVLLLGGLVGRERGDDIWLFESHCFHSIVREAIEQEPPMGLPTDIFQVNERDRARLMLSWKARAGETTSTPSRLSWWAIQPSTHEIGFAGARLRVISRPNDFFVQNNSSGFAWMTLILGGLLSLASSLLLHRVLFARDQAEALAAEKTREALAREREATEARLVAREGEERLRKWESLGVMAAGIAHDFNNQLMVVQGGAEILQSRPLETLEHDYVRMIHSSAVKMAVLCRHMLVFAGQSGGAGRPLDWREVVGPHLQATARRLGVEGRVEFRCGDHLSRSVADHSQVSEIVDHLMANAVEAIATTDQGKIVVTIEERHVTPDSWRYIAASPEFAEGKAIVVSFADNGCGMDSPTLERAFDPFFSTKFLGRGLGLPAVAGFVRSMGGAVGIESRLGVGTVVTLMFPRVGRAASRGEEAVESVASRKSVLSKNGVVFLADDEDQVREVAHKMIERLGFDVLASGDFSSAREILDREARRLSVAVLDFRMEGGPHGTLVSYVRERFPALPVVLITGSRESEVIETLGTSQSWVYLSKPFSLEALQRSLDRALELGSSSRQRCPSDVK